MALVRLLGWLLLVTGLAVFGWDLLIWYDTSHFVPISLQAFWSDLNPLSLESFEAVMERNLATWAWSDVMEAFLALWAAPVLGGAGLVLLWLGRRRPDQADLYRRRS